jgi:CheY-like chemotaxis protein
VTFVLNGTDALRIVRESPPERFDAAILDVMMPPGDELTTDVTHAGRRTGLVVAREIRKMRPLLPLFGYTVCDDAEVADWFARFGSGLFHKPVAPSEISREVLRILKRERRRPKCFIVHGHDDLAVLELKNYLQNSLGLPEPVVLRELPSSGRTVIEKLEETADDVELAFVLLTPDDVAHPAQGSNEMRRRARQNVIFEAGYFLAKLKRRRGAVVLLHKGAVEIPTDIAGMIYIDISGGILAAGEALRRELREWLA